MISAQNIKKYFGTQKIFEGFFLDLKDDLITCVLGKSGCGKTTLLNIFAGTTPFEGAVNGVDGSVSYIFQKERLLPNLTVRQNLQYVLPKDYHQNIDEMLKLLEIFDKADCYPSVLSGGQAQRVSIARAFLFPSKILLMDEPFSSLDTALKIRLTKAFFDVWNKYKRTVLFVTHDIEDAMMLSHRILLLDNGQIKMDISTQNPPPRPYGQPSDTKTQILNALLTL